jgi:hypothetical protein
VVANMPELKILSDIWQTISLQKCIQIADIFSVFLLHKCLLPKCKKKSLKKSGNFPPIPPVQSPNILLTHTKRTKMLVQTHSRLNTDNWFIGWFAIIFYYGITHFLSLIFYKANRRLPAHLFVVKTTKCVFLISKTKFSICIINKKKLFSNGTIK